MSAVIISQAIFYAFQTECAKQTIYITTKKIFELLSFWGASPASALALAPTASSSSSSGVSSTIIEGGGGYQEVIRRFLQDSHIYLKLAVAVEIIKERDPAFNIKEVVTDLAITPQGKEGKDGKEETKESLVEEKKIICYTPPTKKSEVDYESKAIEIACVALSSALKKIHKELELLTTIELRHKQKYFYWARTPAYEKHLSKISAAMKTDFEVCFCWLERAINCRKSAF